MVGTENFRQDFCRFYFFCELATDKNIINSPADVTRSRIRKMTPPRVVSIAFGKNSKRIYEASADYVLNTFALFFSKPFIFHIFFWAGEVVFGVSNVEVATKYYRLIFF